MEEKKKDLIWIVEDQIGLPEMMKMMLSEEKYDFVIYTKAEDAVAALDNLINTNERKPDLIITDNNTKSKMSGMEVLKKAREIGGIRTIMHSSDDVKTQAEIKGAMAFILKPYESNAAFISLVESVLAKPAPDIQKQGLIKF